MRRHDRGLGIYLSGAVRFAGCIRNRHRRTRVHRLDRFPLQGRFHFELVVVDVDSDPALEQRYGQQVPVLTHGARELCHYYLDTPVVLLIWVKSTKIYSSPDKPVADALCASLESEGIRVWIAPRDNLPGKIWGEAIIDAINASKLISSGAAKPRGQR